ncbi:aldose epimerase family protein [Pedobacter sp. UYP30]|uniref:aldose epimerase family protein n=1 Tax=Pedobacter sp. UYP30 TaxID=1756400 RepID=UPI00339B114F
MTVNQIPTGKFIDGEEIVAVELRNQKGTYVKIFNYGTIISHFQTLNAKGELQDIVLGFEDISAYFTDDYLANGAYLGAVIGRYANRIKDGEFQMKGVDYSLSKNSDGNMLHGGIEGFDKKIWEITETKSQPHASVTFGYESEDGEEGFPGNLWVRLNVELTENNELILSYEAKTDQATPINLTHHDYFNLSPNGGSIAKHIQQIFSSTYLAQDQTFAATGKHIDVKDTAFDFSKPKEIGANWDSAEGYDQSFVLDKVDGELTLASRTSEKASGLMLSVYTTEPVVHFYTAKYLNVKNAKEGKDYGAFEAFCVETQHQPNAINIPEFPSTVLEPEDLYSQTTIYKVSIVS